MKNILYILSGIVCATILTIGATKVSANPSIFTEEKSAYATTTVSYISNGVGTTTRSFDTYAGAYNSGVDGATFAFQVTASSTVDTVGVAFRFEDSMDGIDWYPRLKPLNELATTTVLTRISSDYSWAFASSTAGTSNGVNRTHGSFTVDTPMRFVRVVISSKVDGNPFTIWSEFVGKRQQVY